MYDETECVFCFEKFLKENLILYNEKCEFNKYIICFLNQILELDCGHIFHLGCFYKYIKIKFIKQIQCKIDCPFCRKIISDTELVKILTSIDDIRCIKTKIETEIIKLNVKIGFKKMMLYSKKIFYGSENLDEIDDCNKMIESYKELKFIDKKIGNISKNAKVILSTLYFQDYTSFV
jgi:hypothetical protein